MTTAFCQGAKQVQVELSLYQSMVAVSTALIHKKEKSIICDISRKQESVFWCNFEIEPKSVVFSRNMWNGRNSKRINEFGYMKPWCQVWFKISEVLYEV